MPRLAARLFVLVLLGTTVAVAQSRAVVTTADYDRAPRMRAPALNGLVVGGTVNATWLPDGRFTYQRTTLTGTQNVVVDPVRRTSEVVTTPPAGGQASPAAGGRAPDPTDSESMKAWVGPERICTPVQQYSSREV